MVNLVYCGNKYMFDGILLSLLSASKTCKEPLNVTILTGDFSKLNPSYLSLEDFEADFLRAVIKKYNKDNDLELRDISDLIKSELAETANLDNEYTPYCLMRTFLDLLENVPPRVLYLDCDTIVLRDIAPFFHKDLGDKDIGCVIDNAYVGLFKRHYFNAGVMLMDLEKIRHDGLMVASRELIATKKMKHPDQDAMNKIFSKAKKIAYFSRDYNEQRRLSASTVIRHFAPQLVFFPLPHLINVKPWDYADVHNVYHYKDFDQLFKEAVQLKKEFSLAHADKFK